MFELTLSLGADAKKYILSLYKTLKKDVSNDSGIIVQHNMEKRAYLAIAVDEKKKDYYKSKIFDFVVYVIIDKFKYEYFKRNIVFDSKKILTIPFIKAISLFDAEIDREYIAELLEFSGEILIDSFFYFKLQNLALRWEKTANLINQNKILLSESSIIEVLKYISAVADNTSVKVRLEFLNRHIVLENFDERKKFKVDVDGYRELIEDLVKINPAKIMVCYKCSHKKIEYIEKLLNSIYDEKIYIE